MLIIGMIANKKDEGIILRSVLKLEEKDMGGQN
jgi:hypothetical protein